MVGTTDSEAQTTTTVNTEAHLLIAQQRMKKYADRKRVGRTLAVGDMAYLKLQPYRLNAFGLRSHMKLQKKFYGPFRVLYHVGSVAYHLQLQTWVSTQCSTLAS
ncbi:hypothetical protein VPH35_116514 [Triticum aestivum]